MRNWRKTDATRATHDADKTIFHLPQIPRLANPRTAVRQAVITAIVLLSIIGLGMLVQDVACDCDFTRTGLAPNSDYLFGTDWMGRDIFTRTFAGLSTSILIGVIASLVSAVIAVVLGVVAAIGPKWVDAAITWLIDLVLGIPHLLLLILISIALGRGFWGVAIGVAVTHWPSLARVVRAEAMQVRESIYVAQAHALGRNPWQVTVTHYWPALAPQVMVGAVLQFPHAIMHEASVTFLGFGLPPDSAAIGVILSESVGYLSAGMWWAALFPGLALLAVVLIFDAFARAVRALSGGGR
ncbi:MAG: ABC transporter permease [Actinomycetaceae bacterium]|nr:ABC transporter permease [Actinomycetaceae bacterium]